MAAHLSEGSLTFEEFLFLPNTIFKTIGYDFMQLTQSQVLRKLMKCIFIVIFAVHMYCNFYLLRQVFFRVDPQDDVMDIIRLLSSVAYSMNSNIKFFAFILHYELTRKVLGTLLNIYPSCRAEREKHQVNQFTWSKSERFVISFYMVASYGIALAPLLVTISAYAMDEETLFLRAYAVDYDYAAESLWRYVGTYFLEAIHSHYMIIANIGTDLWLIGFTAQLCMHLNCIATELRSHNPKTEEMALEKDIAFLSDIINRHSTILSLHKDLNEIFGIALVFILISTTGVLCIVAVRLVVEGLSVEFMVFCTFLTTALAEFYMVCSWGQRLMNTSESVALAAYNHTWYNASEQYKRLLHFILMRSQTKAELKAIGLKPICLETFKIFTGYAYQIFALLQTTLNLEFSG